MAFNSHSLLPKTDGVAFDFLITGASGLIGWNLLRAASQAGQAVGTYNIKARNLGEDLVIRMNLEDPQAIGKVFSQYKPRIIIHCSAICALGHCEKAPERAFSVNVEGTQNLITAAEEIGARFVFLSTDLVFDGKNPPYPEESKPSPLSIYGRTKALAEERVLNAKLESLIARVAITFGPSVQGNKGPSDWILSRLAKDQPVTLYKDEFRNPLSSTTLVPLLLKLAQSSLTGVIHVAGSERVSRYELGCRLLETLNMPSLLLTPGSRLEAPWPPRPHDLSFDCGKLVRFLGHGLPTLAESLAGLQRIDRISLPFVRHSPKGPVIA
jgi:dTDP-4-dehydrorhamnose reductase